MYHQIIIMGFVKRTFILHCTKLQMDVERFDISLVLAVVIVSQFGFSCDSFKRIGCLSASFHHRCVLL